MQTVTKSTEPPALSPERFESGDPLLAVASDGRVVGWNRALAAFTGIPPGVTLGRPCWEALGALRADGVRVCGPDCPSLASSPTVGARFVLVRTRTGRAPVVLSTMHVERDGKPVVLHLLHAPPSFGRRTEASPLTARQLEVLRLLARGVRPAAIARRLGLAPTTVRNHVSEALGRLGCHSQLEAVAEARRRGLLSE